METIDFATLLTQTHSKLDALCSQLKKLKKTSCTTDLTTLLNNSNKLRDQISKELVECRRVQKISSKCQTLIELYVQSVNVLDESVTFGILLNG